MNTQPVSYRFVSLISTVAPEAVHLPKDVMADLIETWHLTNFSMLHLQYLCKLSEVDKMRDAVARIVNDLSKFSVQCAHIGVARGSHPYFSIFLEPTEDWMILKSLLVAAVSQYIPDMHSFTGKDALPVVQAMTDQIEDQKVSETVARMQNVSFDQIIEINNITFDALDNTNRRTSSETMYLRDF